MVDAITPTRVEEYLVSKSKPIVQAVGGLSVIALLAGGALPRAAQASHAAANATVTIGVSVPLLEYPDLPEGIEYGVKVAVAQANAANVVPGVTFAVKVLDDTINNKHDPAKDAANARTFISDSTVIGEVGPLNSSAAQGSIAVYNQAHLVQISPANTNPDLTSPQFRAKYEPTTAAGKGPITYFRTCTTDAYQGPAAALYAKNVLHAKRVYVTDNTGAYGVGLAKAFQTRAKAIGLTVVGFGELDTTQPKMGADALAANIASQSGGKLDFVYFGGEFGSGGGTFLADAVKAHGLHVGFMGGDGLFDPHFISDSSNGGSLTGFCTSVGPYANVYPPAKSFLAAEAKMFPSFKVSTYDIESYDAANVIIAAYAKALKGGMIKAGQPMTIANRDIIAKLVGQTKNFSGASGTFSFDANGDTTNRVISVYKVTGSGKSAAWVYAGLAPKP